MAHAVGLDGAVCPPGPIPDGVRPEAFAVFAGVLPEDKYKLVKAFQQGGHTVGMCGDGANDAPALRQAQIGIAVSTATDVAKSAAGMVLTEPGLAGIVAAVKEGRMTFQRILTYTLNSIIKKIVTVLFLVLGLIMTGHAILTPLLMVIRDDRRRLPGHVVDHGQRAAVARRRMRGASASLTMAGRRHGRLPAGLLHRRPGDRQVRLASGSRRCRTLAFVALVFGSQATIYAIRRPRIVGLSPEPVACRVVCGGCADRLDIAVGGIAMTPLPASSRRHVCRSRPTSPSSSTRSRSRYSPASDRIAVLPGSLSAAGRGRGGTHLFSAIRLSKMTSYR